MGANRRTGIVPLHGGLLEVDTNTLIQEYKKMTKHFPITRVSILALAAVLAASGAAWGATWYPGYDWAAPPGISNAYMQSIGEAASPQGWSLLPNGTVIGDSSDVQPGNDGMPPGFPYQEGLVWTVNGSTATMTHLGNIEGLAANGASTDSANAMFGDPQGRYAASIDDVGPIGLWNGRRLQAWRAATRTSSGAEPSSAKVRTGCGRTIGQRRGLGFRPEHEQLLQLRPHVDAALGSQFQRLRRRPGRRRHEGLYLERGDANV